MDKPAQNQKGFAQILIVIAIIAVGATVLLFALNRGPAAPESGLGELPPAEERVNATPQSGYSISVGDVNPGNSVNIDEVIMSESGYVVVQNLTASERRTTIGKSDLLEAGIHNNIVVNTDSLVDGEAVYISIYGADNQPVVDENDNEIEVLKNVGLLMGHQMDLPEDQSYY